MYKKPEPIWVPSGERVISSNFHNYFSFLKEHFNKDFKDYNELYEWSISEIEEFWKSIWEYSGIIHSKSYSSVLRNKTMWRSKWFTDSKLNFAQNLLRYRDDHTAIISVREKNPVYRLSYKKLYELVKNCAVSLETLGVKKGDRIAGLVNNYPETVIAMLAATWLGAIWSSTSPDFGLQGVIDRFEQIKPKILFATESYSYSGKHIKCTEKIGDLAEKLTSIERVIIINEYQNLNELKPENIKINKNAKYIKFNQLLMNTSNDIEFIQTDFDHPVYIMYSSGTTGIPKCIVHGAGGTLLQHFKELHLHTDLKRTDVICYYTTCGWMMWNWLISSLMTGASIVLIDGSPVYPDEKTLWNKIAEEKITIFGTSPKYLTGIEKSGLVPKNEFDLSDLKTVLSTGSPLSVENFIWIYKNVKSDVQLSSISGGTDLISCFMLGCPILPVYPGEIQCRGLGMKVESWDETGNKIIGEKGELVCTKPFPSAPVYFWNDEQNKKYYNAYFAKFPGFWHHGDFIKITENGGVIVYGRSDATLNPGGIRIGTAEIYRIVDSLQNVSDSLVIGQDWLNDIRIILFIVLRENEKLDNKLIEEIKSAIKLNATPRHVPQIVIQVKQIPHTISGKKVELTVTRILNGGKPENVEALANPDSLNEFYHIAEQLRSKIN